MDAAYELAGETHVNQNLIRQWDEPSGGTFHVNANWINGEGNATTAPTSTSYVTFDSFTGAPAFPTVSFLGTASSEWFVVRDGNYTFELGGHTYITSQPSGVGEESSDVGSLTIRNGLVQVGGGSDLILGDEGFGVIQLESNGQLQTVHALLGNAPSGTGEMKVLDETSSWTNSSSIAVGDEGTGLLEIKNGGSVSNTLATVGFQSGSSGTVLVDETNSLWTVNGFLHVGSAGMGTMTVSQGGQVDVQSYLGIGATSGSTGTVTVADLGSHLDVAGAISVGGTDSGAGGTGTLDVGGGLVEADGTVEIHAGGTMNMLGGLLRAGSFVSTSGGVLDIDDGVLEIDGGTFNIGGGNFNYSGESAGKEVTLRFTNGGTGTVADAGVGIAGGVGSGRLEVLSGSTFNSGLSRIGINTNSSGTALVDGASSTWNTGDLQVGTSGNGSLTVQNGGTVSSTGSLVAIGFNTSATGNLLVTGANSKLTTTSPLVIGNNGSNGTATVADGGLVDVAGLTTLGANGTLNIDGGTYRTGSYVDTLGGVLDIDDGVLEIDGGTFNIGGGNFNYSGESAGKEVTLRFTNGGTGTVADAGVGIAGGVGSGRLEVLSGSTFNSGLSRIGINTNSSGTALVDGASSTWNTGDLQVGTSGNGSLTVQNGGTVSSTGSLVAIGFNTSATGNLLVTGANSKLTTTSPLVIGNNGSDGTATVASSGLVDVAGLTTLGANGTLKIDGGTYRTGSYVDTLGGVLDMDDGVLEIDGGTFNIGGGNFNYSGESAGKEVTLRFTNGGTGTVADAGVGIAGGVGSGRLEVLSGSTFNSGLSRIGINTNSSGTALVDGASSTWNTGDLQVGTSGNGSLTVQNGGTVSSTGSLVAIGFNTSATGNLLVTGANSKLTTTSPLVIGNNGSDGTATVASSGLVDVAGLTTLGANGTLNIQGGLFRGPTLSNTLGGTFSFTGGSLNVGTFNGTLTQDGGTVVIGSSPGNTNVNGNYVQNAGALEIELGGTTAASEFDTLSVTGTATLAGDLDVSLIDLGSGTFEPQWGQSFQILSASSVSGTFANENLPNLPDNLYFSVDYQSTAVSLGVSLLGDFDNDGQWTATDLDLLAAADGTGDLFFDLDGNGLVEFTPSLSGVNSDSDYLIRTLLNTEYGDANLDRKVDVLDLDQLGQGFQGSGTGWLFGDFDGTGGAPNVLDLDLLGQTFGFDNTLPPAVAVPEPGTLALGEILLLSLSVGIRKLRFAEY